MQTGTGSLPVRSFSSAASVLMGASDRASTNDKRLANIRFFTSHSSYYVFVPGRELADRPWFISISASAFR
ncbi:hypothetical protein HMPREF1545_03060 [Oscillibacter sp. KLE 1728]|nr:hypothetical protein HMPREF1545_03060 [Oscillibacter sp. KLE 1728]